jgi:DNA-binding NtrC family response regulator
MDEIDTFDLKKIGKRAGEKAEKERIEEVLLETCWNRKRAARLLQVSYKTLLFKITKYQLNSVSPVFMSKYFGENVSPYGRKEI